MKYELSGSFNAGEYNVVICVVLDLPFALAIKAAVEMSGSFDSDSVVMREIENGRDAPGV